MSCERITFADGTAAIVCYRGGRRKSKMPIKTSNTPEVAAVLRAFPGSQVVLEILYLPPGKTMLAGYSRIRSIIEWCLKQPAFAGKALPEDAAEVMRWIRDHFGPDEARKAAIEKHGAPADTTRPTPEQLGRLLVEESERASGLDETPWSEQNLRKKEVATATAAAVMRRLDVRLPAKSSARTEASTSKASASSSATETQAPIPRADFELAPTELVSVGPERVEVAPPTPRKTRAKRASAAPQEPAAPTTP